MLTFLANVRTCWVKDNEQETGCVICSPTVPAAPHRLTSHKHHIYTFHDIVVVCNGEEWECEQNVKSAAFAKYM